MPNSQDTDNLGISFRAELVSDKERAFNQRISNLITPTTRMVLRTDSKMIYDWVDGKGVRGFVELQGDIYQVQAMRFDYATQSGLSAGTFSKEHSERNAVKVLVLS